MGKSMCLLWEPMASLGAPALTPKSVTGMQNKRGFSLLEILVVIVITGITLTFAMYAFGDFGQARRIVLAAEQFASYVKLVQQQAILETSTLGVNLSPTRYQAIRFNPAAGWETFQQKGIFNVHYFPSGADIKFAASQGKSSKNDPEIIVNASGDMTPFKVFFNSQDGTKLAMVEGRHDGSIQVHHEN
ncbi:prepilin-type N-terminal cleavage/methylation domain-containing protein [Legionella septentrionalis]|uniref:Type II secretion system protein H n=2 Tax=Legionella septentrionalis TaxID=2498109 RepID=A0A3S0VAQ5_9GAMM|nr:prepilin-type N-terminal cleavage/methylation domain-containing protein [Legionella septentrionalis]